MVFWDEDISNCYIVHYPNCAKTYIFSAECKEHAIHMLESDYQYCECSGDNECSYILHRIPDEELIENGMIIGEGSEVYEIQLTATKLELDE